MKKVLALCIFIVGISFSSVFAQGVSTKGFIGGLNMSNVSGDDVQDNKIKLGYAVGGFWSFKVGSKFSIRPEIYYTSKGFILETKENESNAVYDFDITATGTLSLNYIEVPVLGVFSVNRNLNVFAGPYLDYYLSGEMERKIEGNIKYNDGSGWVTENVDRSETEELKSEDMTSPGYGLTAGAEYLFGQFSIGARYSLGLSNIPKEEEGKFNHTNIQVMVAFYLP